MPPPAAPRWPPTLATLPAGLLVIIAAISVQVGASVAAGLFEAYGPVTMVGLRLIFGAAWSWPCVHPACARRAAAPGEAPWRWA